MRIFLDVGAWEGITVRAINNTDYVFDKIYCFEPQPDQWGRLKKNFKNINLCEFGLWKETCTKILYQDNHSNGASIFPDKFREITRSYEVNLVKASEWFKENIKEGDYVVLKLNCEGSECDILDDLMDSGEFKKVSAMVVSFDVMKIPSQIHREEEIKKRLKEYNIPILIADLRDRVRWKRNYPAWVKYWLDKIVIK